MMHARFSKSHDWGLDDDILQLLGTVYLPSPKLLYLIDYAVSTESLPNDDDECHNNLGNRNF